MRYTKEFLEPFVSSSFSVAEVLRKIGLKRFNGGTHAHLTRRLKQFGLDMTHFRGQGANCGGSHKGGYEKLPWQRILVENRRDRKEKVSRLRNAMIAAGIPHICRTCGMGPIWNGQKLVLQISHGNGNPFDNRKDNLSFECPNCHSQTDDFGGRGAGKNNLLVAKSANAAALNPAGKPCEFDSRPTDHPSVMQLADIASSNLAS